MTAELGFDFTNPLLKTAFDLRNGFHLAQMSGLVEVVEVGTQFEQELLGRSVTHTLIDFAHRSVRTQDYSDFEQSRAGQFPERG